MTIRETVTATWIRFELAPRGEGRITDQWIVLTRPEKNYGHEDPLGVVKWFTRWRRYCFFPLSDTAFEQDCLRDIADFCEKRTGLHRATRMLHREAAS